MRTLLEAEYPKRDEEEGEADDGEIEVEVGEDLLVSGRALEDSQVEVLSLPSHLIIRNVIDETQTFTVVSLFRPAPVQAAVSVGEGRVDRV